MRGFTAKPLRILPAQSAAAGRPLSHRAAGGQSSRGRRDTFFWRRQWNTKMNIPCSVLKMVKRYAMTMEESLRKRRPKVHVRPSRQRSAKAPNTHDLQGASQQQRLNKRNSKNPAAAAAAAAAADRSAGRVSPSRQRLLPIKNKEQKNKRSIRRKTPFFNCFSLTRPGNVWAFGIRHSS